MPASCSSMRLRRVRSARTFHKQSPTGLKKQCPTEVSDLGERPRRLQSARPLCTFDESRRQTPRASARGLGVARERTGAVCRPGGSAGRGERGMGCGTQFLDGPVFRRGKRAENKLKTAIFGRGNHSQKTINSSHVFPVLPTIWSARDRRGLHHDQARGKRPGECRLMCGN